MKILFIGDIIGRPGRTAVKKILGRLKSQYLPDFIVANGENLAGGMGMTLETYQEMRDAGIDFFTSGNHIWAKRNFVDSLDNPKIRVIRPANYPPDVPGRGYQMIEVGGKKVLIINLIGRAFMSSQYESPFLAFDKIYQEEGDKADIILIDFHAEATSEKALLSHYVDGKVSALVGTHTHIQTNDARVLPEGTAFITDLGMVGPLESSIGADIEPFLETALTQIPGQFKVGTGDVIFNAALIETDSPHRAKSITIIKELVPVGE